jgi:EAL domain-containing protein (putative c-di-GMP-specific phosphodiesterase class I)
LAVGNWIAQDRVLRQETAVAQGIASSIDDVLTAVRANQSKLAVLVGRPCSEVKAQLTFADAFIPYLRSAVLVRDGNLYCSTVLGPRSVPLSAYLIPSGAAQQIAFVQGSTLMPAIPLMAVYDRVDDRNGILYLVEGTYIADILARAEVWGAIGASVSGRSGGTLTSQGRWLETAGSAQGHVVVASSSSELIVALKSNPAKRRADLITTEVVALAVGMAVFAALVAGYMVGFTPRQRLARQIRTGLRRREFFLEYQPIVNLKNGHWIGAEALLRWNHPQLGCVMPGKFISEIENTSVIAPLTEFVLGTALRELDALAFPNGFRVNVNIAPHHTQMDCFPKDVSSTLTESATLFQVVLEITERGLLDGGSAVQDSLSRLKALGVKFAVDDFGTANSNLSLLQRFPFDYIKIDRQFIQHAAGRDRQLIEGISLLGEKLGASIIAEGVEEVEQHDALKEIGIGFAQGFLFLRPTGIVEFARIYRQVRSETGA